MKLTDPLSLLPLPQGTQVTKPAQVIHRVLAAASLGSTLRSADDSGAMAYLPPLESLMTSTTAATWLPNHRQQQQVPASGAAQTSPVSSVQVRGGSRWTGVGR
jgi:hypothetical protein